MAQKVVGSRGAGQVVERLCHFLLVVEFGGVDVVVGDNFQGRVDRAGQTLRRWSAPSSWRFRGSCFLVAWRGSGPWHLLACAVFQNFNFARLLGGHALSVVASSGNQER